MVCTSENFFKIFLEIFLKFFLSPLNSQWPIMGKQIAFIYTSGGKKRWNRKIEENSRSRTVHAMVEFFIVYDVLKGPLNDGNSAEVPAWCALQKNFSKFFMKFFWNFFSCHWIQNSRYSGNKLFPYITLVTKNGKIEK